MPHAILRGANGRRHEVDFGDAPVRVQIYASEETVEIFIEADFDTLPEKGRRFAILNIPRHLLRESCGSSFSDKPCIFYTFHVHSAIIAECHAIPVGSRSAVTMTASSSSIVSAKILSWESAPIPARSRRFT